MKTSCLKFLPLIIFFIMGLFIFPAKAWAAASLSFSPASQSVTLNNNFNISVILNTGGSDTDGADVIVNYDGNRLQIVSATLGDLYANKLVVDTSTNGKITLRATTTADQSYNGTGTFATLSFKAIAEGTANVYFDFTSGSTTDSNVAYLGDDLLGSVSNGSYTISQSTTSTTTSSPSPGASATTSVGGGETTTDGAVPVSGSVEPTIILLAGGAILLIIGGLKMLLPAMKS